MHCYFFQYSSLQYGIRKLINDYKHCLNDMDILDEENTGYTHNFNITEEQIRAYITDDLTGETCVWTVNEVEVNL